MAWNIRFIESPPLRPIGTEFGRHYDGTVDFDKLAIGDLVHYHYRGRPCMDRAQLDGMHLTAHYFAFNLGRPPLILVLPNASGSKLYHMVDGQCYSNNCTKCGQKAYKNTCVPSGSCTPRGYYDGWTVTGAPPAITIAPSVNYDDDGPPVVKHYHGFVQNGIIGDG